MWSCGALLSTPPQQSEKTSHFYRSCPLIRCGGVDNKMPQLHATQSEPLDYRFYGAESASNISYALLKLNIGVMLYFLSMTQYVNC